MCVNNPDRSAIRIHRQKNATYSDCVGGVATGVPKAKQSIPTAERLRHTLSTRIGLNLFVFIGLRRRRTWWHAPCIKRWCEHNQYYEQQIHIHLRPTSPVGRKRSRRSRDCSLCSLYSECRLLNLAVRANASDRSGAWNQAVRSMPLHYVGASRRHLISLLFLPLFPAASCGCSLLFARAKTITNACGHAMLT